jgi:predicted porin
MKALSKAVFPLTALALSAVAHAQSSVTLYGLVDESVQYVHNVAQPNGKNGNKIGLYAGNIQGDRFGLRGVEDLGAGLQALFQFENGFNVNTGTLGQGGRLFGRQAWAGLKSEQFGKVSLGRQYDPAVDLVQPLTGVGPWGSPFAAPGDVDNNDNGSRINNSIKYTSPNIAGFSFETMYAFGGVAGQTGSAQSWGAAGQYSVGGLSVAAGYLKAYNAESSSARALLSTPWSGTTDGNFGSPVTSGLKTAKSYGILSTAIGYKLGGATVGLRYSNAQYVPDVASAFPSTEIFNTAAGYFGYQVTSAMLFGAQYNYTHASGQARANYQQISFGGDYYLSKRTDLYLVGVFQHMTGDQVGVVPGSATAADYGYASAPGTSSQEIVSIGIRHKF